MNLQRMASAAHTLEPIISACSRDCVESSGLQSAPVPKGIMYISHQGTPSDFSDQHADGVG